MAVNRIVANVATPDPETVARFYRDVFGLATVMDHGWIVTLASGVTAPVQISLAAEGGSGTPVPAISIEVDDLDATLERARAHGAPIVYGPTLEDWGVRRFYVTDPAGTIVNVLTHDQGRTGG